MLAFTVGFCLFFFLIWGAFAELDEITRAHGNIVVSSRTQVVQSAEGGTIEQILVGEGDIVEEGQELLYLDKTRVRAAFLDAKTKVAGLSAQASRLRAEVFGGPIRFDEELVADFPDIRSNEERLLRKRRAAFEEDVAASQKVLALVQQELSMLLPLLETGDVSKTEVLRLQRQEADLASQITNRRNKYFQDTQAELNKMLEDLESARQTLNQRTWQLENTVLKSPLRGTVKNIRLTTRGGVLRAGEEALQIVPLNDDLLVEAKLDPKDIAYVRPGMPVSVKVDAYESSIYGTLPGTLTFISADAFEDETRRTGDQPYYRVRVQTTGRRFSGRPDEDLEIQPGMTATIEIKTGSKSVLAYIFKPVLKTLDHSLSER